MKPAINILYNGKKFESIERAKAPDEELLVTMKIALDVEAVLEPLREEIEKAGGHVSINVKGPSMFEIPAENLPRILNKGF